MNTSVRARQDARGFSFIELLVTIIIAGIAFAALVPLFVSAQQQGAGDQARNVALSLARDKMEKIRQLDYDQINLFNLESSAFHGQQFGKSVDISGGGGTKTYTVDYSVTFVGGTYKGQSVDYSTSGDKSERYKQVTVTAYWTGNPTPVKKVVLETSVYKQYMGSRIDRLVVSPKVALLDSADLAREFVNGNQVTFTAYVNDADASRTSDVTFKLYNYNGQLTATLKVLSTPADAGVYTATFDVPTSVAAPGMSDGAYTVKAAATNTRGYSSNTVEESFSVELGAPPAPVVTTVSYSHTIDLSWPNTTAGDVARYDIYRSTVQGAQVYPGTPTASVTYRAGGTPSYHDTGLENDTQYPYTNPAFAVYYKIQSVDGIGRPSSDTIVSDIPHVPLDDVAPLAITGFTATFSTPAQVPSLYAQLHWNATSDPVNTLPKPTSGMGTYWIYRSDNGGAWKVINTITHVAGQLTYDWTDTSLKPLVTYDYYMVAVDNDGNASPATQTFSGTTPNYLYNHALVRNDSNQNCSVTITNLDGTPLDSWPLPGGALQTTMPFTLSKQSGSTKDQKYVYLAVGFTYKLSIQKLAANGSPSGPPTSITVTVNAATPDQIISI